MTNKAISPLRRRLIEDMRLPRIGGHLAKLQRERKGVEWARDDVILPMSSSGKR